ncbi:MAG TPA: threonine ammonia-lyase [Acidimicrobiales bacterium]|jgi:threonine dehydratase|nr:threonine ammonia-lyase [Acidimicrobiales bacterium]
MPALVTLADVRDAAARVGPILRATPVSRIESVSRLCGIDVRLKEEQRQRTGSFKIRGAYNCISRLPAGSEVVAASAGNHGQGVALAASLCGLSSSIFMPSTASLPKVKATQDYGATVQFVDGVIDDAVDAAKAFAKERGAVFVPPFDDPLVIAGQGTLALELAEDVPDAATIVVPIGGGGLVAGIAGAYAELMPSVRVIGVEAEGAAAMRASLDAGEVRALTSLATIADGIAVKSPSPLTLAHAQAFVADVVTVSDAEIGEALVALLEYAKAVVEPSGAAGLAAVLAGKVQGPEPVVVVLSGGNVDSLLLAKLIEHGLSVTGRYLRLRIDIPDRPGSLAAVTAMLAELGLNVLDVEHHREGLATLGVDEVELAVTVETRGLAHRDLCLKEMRRRGWSVRVD